MKNCKLCKEKRFYLNYDRHSHGFDLLIPNKSNHKCKLYRKPFIFPDESEFFDF